MNANELGEFFAEIVGEIIRAEDKIQGDLEKLRDQGEFFDPEDVKIQKEMIQSGLTSEGGSLPTLDEKIESIHEENIHRGKILEIWPIFTNAAIYWNPEMDLESPVKDFLDNAFSKDYNFAIILGTELLEVGFAILSDLNPLNKKEIAQKLNVIQKCYTLLKKAEIFDQNSESYRTLNDKINLADEIESLFRGYTELWRKYLDTVSQPEYNKR